MDSDRSTYIMIILAALFLVLGTLTAHAQTATPTATPTPGTCSLNPLPNPPFPPNTPPECNTGAAEPSSPLGISGGNYNSVAFVPKTGTITCCTGTLGALVENNKSVPMVLGASHIFARQSSTAKSVGANESIVQPGLVDLGCWQDPTDQVAKLTSWSKINFSGGANTLDAAVATVVDQEQMPGGPKVPGVDPEGRILNIGQISTTPFPFTSLFDGLHVMKMGRTSCLTTGAIDAFDAMGKVIYPGKVCNVVSSGTAFFNSQILVIGEGLNNSSGQSCTFAQTGDAGALVVTLDFSCPQAIGMIFAGTPAAGTPYGPDISSTIVAVNPIGSILNKFGVTLVGQSCTPTSFSSELDSQLMPQVSAAKRASIEVVRAVKNRHAMRLMKIDAVTAIGIGAGDDANHAALNIYLSKDTPAIRAKVLKEVTEGVAVHFRHAPKFQIL